MSGDPAQFKSEVKAFFVKVDANIHEAVNVVALDVFDGATLRAPVDLGRFRASMQLGDGKPNEKVHPEIAAKIQDRGDAINESTKAGFPVTKTGTVFVSNNLPYATALENGHSKQSSDGVFLLALLATEARLEAGVLSI